MPTNKAFEPPKNYYSADQVENLSQIDPLFGSDLVGERSGGKPCATGTTVIAVDGSGDVTRCHFVMTPLGNIYTDPLLDIICPPDTFRPCQRSECNCFQGYVHLKTSTAHPLYPGQAALARLRNG
jgi:MoaA/NifB/PqqE/SkfB family radical SAM enzyme